MTRKNKIVLIFIQMQLIFVVLFSQNQESFWCMGSTIINFRDDTILFSKNYTVEKNKLSSEGSATFSDCNGNLLFYSNGYTIWDRTHKVMKNGDSLTPHNIISTVQAAVILPVPESKTKYYVFSNDGLTTGTGDGVFYSIVDMSLPGNGSVELPQGEVVSKLNLIVGNTYEAMTSTIHGNGKDFWLFVSVDKSKIYTYLVDSSGINGSPFILNLDSLFVETGLVNELQVIKTDKKGTKVTFNCSSGIVISNFNNSTGEITNLNVLKDGQSGFHALSPDGNFLYSSKLNSTFSNSVIIQYDLKSNNIIESAQTIKTSTTFGGLNIDIQTNYKNKSVLVLNHNSIWKIYNPDAIGVGAEMKKEYDLPAPNLQLPATWHWFPNSIVYHPKSCDPDTIMIDTMVVIPVDTSVIESKIILSNVFSPNGDGYNDYFFIPTKGIVDIEYSIFDRWGNLVYRVKNTDDRWNGKNDKGQLVSDGIYFYVVKATDKNGKEYNTSAYLQLLR